jgi:hypothetical protein
MPIRVLIIVLALLAPVATAHAADKAALPAADICLPGIMTAERAFALPAKLLHTIAIVESGRIDPTSGRTTPWPWTINVGGVGHYFETKDAAIEAVRDFQAAGIRSVDVGCMQINLMHHPNAFTSLDEAFDPRSNTQYGARFLNALYHEIGNWPQAAAAYHSRTQELGARYETRVMAIWPLANRFPDATLRLRGQPLEPAVNVSNYTPAFAAQVRQMRADVARLSATWGRPARALNQAGHPARPDYNRYTPELASELRQAARSLARYTAAMPRPDGRSNMRIASQIAR